MLTKVLAIYSGVLTTVLTAFVLGSSLAANTRSFDEIDVRRKPSHQGRQVPAETEAEESDGRARQAA